MCLQTATRLNKVKSGKRRWIVGQRGLGKKKHGDRKIREYPERTTPKNWSNSQTRLNVFARESAYPETSRK